MQIYRKKSKKEGKTCPKKKTYNEVGRISKIRASGWQT